MKEGNHHIAPRICPGVEAAALLHLVTEPTRHSILVALLEGEQTVSALTRALDGEQSNISHHLRVLRDAGLVRDRRDGRTRYYRLADPELRRLLAATEALATDLERVAYLARMDLPLDAAFHGYG